MHVIPAVSRILGCSINRFKKIDCWRVHDTSLRHRFLEIGRSSESLGHPGILSVEDDYNLALIAVGRVVDPWIDKARRPLHLGMLIEDGAPMAAMNGIPATIAFCTIGVSLIAFWTRIVFQRKWDRSPDCS